MNQDTYGDSLRYQESPGMKFDTARRHKTEFQEVDSHKKSQDSGKIVADVHHLWYDSEPGVVFKFRPLFHPQFSR